MKLGIKLSINLSKIDKSKIFEGKKGKYLNLTTFVDTEKESQYGDHGTITHEATKEDRQQDIKPDIVGNAKVFWQGGQTQKPQLTNQKTENHDDIPF